MKTTGIAGRKLEKLDTLTSLRFFAAAMIVAGHGYGYFHFPDFPTQLPLNQGVSFFFVLSGFVLAYAYPELPSFKHIIHFMWARFARIWPAHIASLILMFCLVPVALWYVSPSHPLLYSLANGMMVHAWIPFRESYLGLNGVSWSISTEFFFYMCFPLLIYKWHSTWAVKMIIVFMMLIAMVVMSNILHLPANSSYQGAGAHALIYVHPLSRLFEFALGIMACGLFKTMKLQANQLSFVGATLIEAFVVVLSILLLWLITLLSSNVHLIQLIGDAGMVWFKSSGASIMFFVLIIVFAFQKGLLSTILRRPILVLLGEVSFSLYLVHTIILKYFDTYDLFEAKWSYLSYWLLSILIAYLIYRTIEMPCRAFLLSWVRRGAVSNVKLSALPQSIVLLWKKRAFWLFCALLSITIGMGQWHFSTLTLLDDKQVQKQLNDGNLLQGTARFSDGLDLLAISAINHDDQIELEFVWCAQQDITLNQYVAIHLLNHQHEIKAKADVLLDKGHSRIDRGHCFQLNQMMSKEAFNNVRQLGIALYVNIQTLNQVESGKTDWGGRRLLISFPGLDDSLTSK